MRIRVRRPSLSALTATLLLVSLALVMGACGNDEPGVASGEVKTYTDATYGYSFEYPAGWKLEEADTSEVTAGASSVNSVGVFDPDGAIDESDLYVNGFQLSVYELAISIDKSLLPDVKPELEALMANLASQSPGFETLEAMSETEVAGLEGFEVTCSFNKNGVPATSTLYFLFDGPIEYQLTLQAASEDWDAMQGILDTIVASFESGAAE